ncbi:MAG: hypothetical protein KJZ55_10765, partial [Flavobacteriales bacterium]|nr:hypothetical protein [Flavobacteriales bacterium]
PIDLEQNTDYVFTREFTEGEGTDDDHGAFVPASAYLLLSDAFTVPKEQLTLIDPDRPNLTGKDYVQKPLMVATAENDLFADTSTYFTPVTEPVGLNAAPSYGLAVAGANHLTPVTQFDGTPSWDTSVSLLFYLGNYFTTLNEFTTAEQQDATVDFDDALGDFWAALFGGLSNDRDDEEDRLDVYKDYTLNFWDAFVSPEYDGATALTWLNQSESNHEYPNNLYGLDFGARQPKQVFIVRDSAGAPLLQFQSDGNLLVTQGELLTSQSTLSQTTGVADFVLKDISGTIQALVCETVGDFRIRGALSDNQSSLSTDPNTPELIIRDASGTPLFIIDEDGNLSLTGNVYDDNDL